MIAALRLERTRQQQQQQQEECKEEVLNKTYTVGPRRLGLPEAS